MRESPTRPRSSPLRLDPQASPDGASRLPLHLAHTTYTAHSHVRSSTCITLTLPHSHYSPLTRSAPRRQEYLGKFVQVSASVLPVRLINNRTIPPFRTIFIDTLDRLWLHDPGFRFIGIQSIVEDNLIVLARVGRRRILGHSGDGWMEKRKGLAVMGDREFGTLWPRVLLREYMGGRLVQSDFH